MSSDKRISRGGQLSEGEVVKTMTGRGGTAGSGSCLTANSFGKQLLPVIPRKLQRRIYHTVSSVNSSCHYAIRSYDEVHRHAKVHSQSSETVVLIKHFPSEGVEAIAVYFMKDNFCRELPPIPPLDRGIPPGAESVSFDGGKVYVLGGHMEQDSTLDDDGRHVYVLDLAGETQWKRCASMHESREKFGCGSMDGKIYVFGGIYGDKSVFGSEVYDPVEDAWFPIKPMQSLRYIHQVARVEEELFVYNGIVYFDPEDMVARIVRGMDSRLDDAEIEINVRERAKTWEAYHPVRDEWRVVPDLGRDGPEKFPFMAKGKLHGMCPLGISVYDFATNSWIRTHRHSFPDLASDTVPFIYRAAFPFAVKAVGDELLAVVHWPMNETGESSLVRSTGLGRDERIVWRKVQAPLCFPDDMVDLYRTQFSINPIQLSIRSDQLIPPGIRASF